jgi:hypothetical protein
MKRLKTGVVNTLSFVKLGDFTVNSFDITLEKTVGTGSLTITNLTDLNNLDSCKDFIQLNIDLLSNEIDGGEYELTITNSGNSYTYLTEVQSYQYNALGNGIYSNSVVLSNEVDAEAPGQQIYTQQQEADNMIVVFSTSLSEAQSVIDSGSELTGSLLVDTSTYNLSDLIAGNYKMYVKTSIGGNYIHHTNVNPTSGTTNNLPFVAYHLSPYYTSVTLNANELTEVKSYGSLEMLPVITGMSNATARLQFNITKEEYVDDLTAFFNANPNIQYDNGYGAIPQFVNNLGQKLKTYLADIVDDVT